MTPQDFTYWLQGFAELNEGPPNSAQWQSIREHLSLVFNKVTPPVRSPLADPPIDPSRYWAPLAPNPQWSPSPTITCVSGGTAPLTYC